MCAKALPTFVVVVAYSVVSGVLAYTKLNMLCTCSFAVSTGEFGLDVEDYLTGLSSAYRVLSYLLCEMDYIYGSTCHTS